MFTVNCIEKMKINKKRPGFDLELVDQPRRRVDDPDELRLDDAKSTTTTFALDAKLCRERFDAAADDDADILDDATDLGPRLQNFFGHCNQCGQQKIAKCL